MKLQTFPLAPHIEGDQQVILPVGAQILGIEERAGQPVLLALVDPDQQLGTGIFYLVREGSALPDPPGLWLGRAGCHSDGRALHVFERTRPAA